VPAFTATPELTAREGCSSEIRVEEVRWVRYTVFGRAFSLIRIPKGRRMRRLLPL